MSADLGYWLSVLAAVAGIALVALTAAIIWSLALTWREHDDDRP